jgi:hypothetical protein
MSAVLDTPATARTDASAGGVRELIALALPVILTNLSATLMMTTDAVMVGRLGATALGAVGYAGIWYWTVVAGFNGTGNGVQTFVAQAHGAGRARLRRVALAGVVHGRAGLGRDDGAVRRVPGAARSARPDAPLRRWQAVTCRRACSASAA